MKKAPILPLSEIIKKDRIVSSFVRIDRQGRKREITIEDLQKHICDIQLNENVPRDVQMVFKNAKDLYIFGYFRYYFFSISEHYAFLALESAIKNKYNQCLPKEVTISCGKKSQKLASPTFESISEFAYTNRGWHPSGTRVNGERFPYSNNLLINWLAEKKFIKGEDKKRYEAGVFLRSTFSHLTQISIDTPSPGTLEVTADLINKLF